MRQALLAIVSMLLLGWPWTGASAQVYPARPVRLVVGAPVGSGIDVAARILAQRMREDLGQPVVVDVKAGADGIIAARHVATSPADGYTLFPASNGYMAINPILYETLPYDPSRDFEPVSMFARFPAVLVVNPSVPAHSVREFIAYAKAHPGKLNFGTASSNFVFAMERFKQLTGTDLHHIPYTGLPSVMTALLAGDVHVTIANIVSPAPHIKSAKLRALAVLGDTREALLPDVPTLAEAGVRGYDLDIWVGMFAPAGTPKDVIARLQATIERSVADPEVRDKMIAAGITPVSSTSRQLRETVVSDTAKYRALAGSSRPVAK